MSRFASLVLALAVWCAALVSVPARADTPTPKPAEAPAAKPAPSSAKPAVPPASQPKTEEAALRARIKEVSEAPGLDDAQRKALLAVLNDTLEHIRRTSEFAAKSAAFEAAVRAAPKQLAQYKQAASQPASQPATQPAGLSADEVQARLKAEQIRLAELTQQVEAVAKDLAERVAEQEALPKHVEAAKAKLKELGQAKAQLAESKESPALVDARKAMLAAAEKALRAELDTYQKQEATYETRGSVLRARQQALARDQQQAEATVKTLQSGLARRRAADAARRVTEAKQAASAAAGKHKLVAGAAAENVKLAEQSTGKDGLLARRTQVAGALAEVETKLADLEAVFGKAQRLAEQNGAGEAISALLKEKKDALPDVEELRQGQAARKKEIDARKLLGVQWEEQAKELADAPAAAKKLLEAAKPPLPADAAKQAQEDLTKVLEDRKVLLTALRRDYDGSFAALLKLDAAEGRLAARAEAFAEFQAKVQSGGKGLDPDEGKPAAPKITKEMIETASAALADAKDVDDDVRKAAQDAYAKALVQLAAAKKHVETVNALEAAVKDAPRQLQQYKDALSATTQPVAAVPDNLPLDKMEAQLTQLRADLTDLEKKSAALDGELGGRTTRQDELSKALAAAQEQAKKVAEELTKLQSTEDAKALKDARKALLDATGAAIEAELAGYRKEQATFETRGTLLRAQKQAYEGRRRQLNAVIKAWQTAVAQQQEREAQRQLAEERRAVEEAAKKHPIAEQVALENQRLATLRTGETGLTQKQRRAAEQLDKTKKRLADLEEFLTKIEQLGRDGGASDLIGLLLRQQRDSLPDQDALDAETAARRAEITRIRLEIPKLEEQVGLLVDVHAMAGDLIATAQPPVGEDKKDELQTWLVEALQRRRELIHTLIQDHESYFNALLKLDATGKQLSSRVTELRDYIDEQILWIRSTDGVSFSDVAAAGKALAWLADPAAWTALGAALLEDARDSLLAVGLAALLVAGLWLGRRPVRRRLAGLAAREAEHRHGTFWGVLWAVAGTVVLAGAGAVTLWVAGWRCGQASDAALARAVAGGLLAGAAVWFPLALLGELCRADGLGVVHFRWPVEAVRAVPRTMGWLAPVAALLAALVAAMECQPIQAHRSSLGRMALMALLLIGGGVLLRLFRPSGALVRDVLGRRESNWSYRFRHLWFAVLAAGTALLVAAAWTGYYYTAVQLAWRALAQFWVMVLLVVLNAVALQWFLLSRRRMAQRAVEARRQSKAEEAPGADAEETTPAELRPARSDVADASAQVRLFVRYAAAAALVIATWIVWADVLPALGVVHGIALWSAGTPEAPVVITLGHLLLSAGVFVLTFVIGGNLPGLLEVAVLQRVGMDTGAQYAVTRLARYTLTVIGVVISFYLIGITWAHTQWLVAAMTVGLGFGLQEIFANFVSGLIILFERPVRVGDVVTVGEISGTVTKIRIRATTIVDWDRKELIVPNKEFITGRLTNWTLSDPIIRVVMPIGVAYGTDTDLVEKLLLEVAEEDPRVLDTPASQAYFAEFGEESLNFELRVYVTGVADYLSVRNTINRAINRTLTEAGIEIPFPMRDVSIRSVECVLPVRRARPAKPAEPPAPTGKDVVDPPPGV